VVCTAYVLNYTAVIEHSKAYSINILIYF